MIEYGFQYRGNGYGFWSTWEEAEFKSFEKRLDDKSGFKLTYGPVPTAIYECVDGKPVRCLYMAYSEFERYPIALDFTFTPSERIEQCQQELD